MQNFWQQIETDVKKFAPDLLHKLCPGADDRAIAQAEHLLEIPRANELRGQ